MGYLLSVVLSLLFIGSLYTWLGLFDAYGQINASAVICKDDGPCRIYLSNSSGSFTLEGPADIIAPMTPIESALFDHEMEIFDREMD